MAYELLSITETNKQTLAKVTNSQGKQNTIGTCYKTIYKLEMEANKQNKFY